MNCDIAWYDGGRDNPVTIREFQWIQNNPIQHYGVSREEVEELYGKDSNYINYEGEEFGADVRATYFHDGWSGGYEFQCRACDKIHSKSDVALACCPDESVLRKEEVFVEAESLGDYEGDLSMTLANMERELGIDSEDYEDYGKYTNPTARLSAAISKIEREFDVNEEDFQYRGHEEGCRIVWG